MYSYGSPHTAAQKQDDQHERTFSSYVRIQVVVLKTCLGRWTIGRSGERGSGISVLPARYDDDDDDIYIYIYIQRVEAKYVIIFKILFLFLVWCVQFKKKICDKSKFLWLVLLFKHIFFFNQYSAQYEWARKRNSKESIICLMLKPNQSFFVNIIQSKEKILPKNNFLRKRGSGGLNKNKKKVFFLTALAMAIKKDPTASIRKHTNELKICKKTVRSAIKQDLSPDLNSLDYTTWCILENNTNATSLLSIGLLKTALRGNWIKCLKNFFEGKQIISKVCWYNNKKNDSHTE